MQPIRTFEVIPFLPPQLDCLKELAFNLRWSWDHETIHLFQRLDHDLWESTGHNPVLMLGTISQARLDEAAKDEGFLAHLDRICQRHYEYLKNQGTWYKKQQRQGPISPRSSALPNVCLSTPAVSASWPGTILKPPRSWDFRW
jgi:glycogen phosphorylase